LDVVFFVYVYMMGVRSCMSGLHCDEVIILWEPPKRVDFVAQICWILGYNTSV